MHTTIVFVLLLLGLVSAQIGNQPPLQNLNMYLDAFHFTNGDLCSQMEAHHYCSILDNGVVQCILFSNNTQGARLMGVEYIITSDKFGQLDEDEKKNCGILMFMK